MNLIKAAAVSLALTIPALAIAECTQEETEKRVMYGANTAVKYIVSQCVNNGYFTIEIGKAQPLYFVCNLGQMSMEDTDEVKKESDLSERPRG